MRIRFFTVFVAILYAGTVAVAKGKDKPVFPPAILAAHTVSVLIDPDTGVSIEDPQANQVARRDVETALLNWGRFQPTSTGQPADLVIVIRRGQKHLVDDNLTDPRQNNRVGAITPSNDGLQIGGQQGQSPGSNPAAPAQGTAPSMHTEMGSQDDSFLVYDGSSQRPLQASAIWRYTAQDGLRPHSVPAVNEFRKAIAAAEKAAAKKP